MMLTCTACRTSLRGVQERRSHYRSDLHRVNVKRKVTGMGPLSHEEFEYRVAVLEAEKTKAAEGRETQFCDVCSKKFSSSKALENHVNSRRHRDALQRVEEASVGEASTSTVGVDEEMVGAEGANGSEMDRDVLSDNDSDVEAELERRVKEWETEKGVRGVFDDEIYEDSEECLKAMGKLHGFWVPWVERLVDVEGLVRYLGQKVGIGYACVGCDKGFASADAARRHMKAVGHCRMTGDDEGWMMEFEEYYNWGDIEADAEEGWEEVDGDIDGGVVQKMYVTESESNANRAGAVALAMGVMRDAERGDAAEDEVGLVVGNKVVGHRSLVRYYKQSGGSRGDSRAGVVANRGMQEHRMIGFKKQTGALPLSVSRGMYRRHQRFELLVGGQNYYTRKARFKQSMAVFNSGYRA